MNRELSYRAIRKHQPAMARLTTTSQRIPLPIMPRCGANLMPSATAMASERMSMSQVSSSSRPLGSDKTPNRVPSQKTRPQILSEYRVLSAVRVVSPTRDQTQRRMIRCNMVPKSRLRYPATWSMLPTASSSRVSRSSLWTDRFPGWRPERNVLCDISGPTYYSHGWVIASPSRLPRAWRWGRCALHSERSAT